MSNTQYNWYVGMPVIMTADIGRGRTDIPNGEYRGKITGIEDGMADAEFPDFPDVVRCFYLVNGINISYPGMSIRPAEEEKCITPKCDKCDTVECSCGGNGGYLHCDKCGAKDKRVGAINPLEYTTPSQWIEGEIPQDYRGYAWLCGGIYGKPVFGEYRGDTGKIDYTHWMPAQLPPPPPVAEVEAYGILSAINELIPVGTPVTESIVQKISLYRNFYSQLATAEVLKEYVECVHPIVGIEDNCTLDQFINWHKEAHSDKLLFTPAALKELGVK